jgi:hypothetical protein
MFGIWRRKKVEVHQHWYVPLFDFRISTQEFYSAIEKELEERKVPDLEIVRVDFAEGGLLSAQRQYLRLRRERLVLDICSAPFGTSWFFSLRGAVIPRTLRLWEFVLISLGLLGLLWLYIRSFGLIGGGIAIATSSIALIFFLSYAPRVHGLDDALLQLPVIGGMYELFRKETYYRHDTQLMYLDIVPRIVHHQIEEFTRAAGVKAVETKHCSTCRPLDLPSELGKGLKALT